MLNTNRGYLGRIILDSNRWKKNNMESRREVRDGGQMGSGNGGLQ